MSVDYCHEHNRRYDTDYVEECPLCLEAELSGANTKYELGEI